MSKRLIKEMIEVLLDVVQPITFLRDVSPSSPTYNKQAARLRKLKAIIKKAKAEL